MKNKLIYEMIGEEIKLNIYNQFNSYKDSIMALDTFYPHIIKKLFRQYVLSKKGEKNEN